MRNKSSLKFNNINCPLFTLQIIFKGYFLVYYHLSCSFIIVVYMYGIDITDHYGYYGEVWAFVVDGLIETAK